MNASINWVVVLKNIPTYTVFYGSFVLALIFARHLRNVFFCMLLFALADGLIVLYGSIAFPHFTAHPRLFFTNAFFFFLVSIGLFSYFLFQPQPFLREQAFYFLLVSGFVSASCFLLPVILNGSSGPAGIYDPLLYRMDTTFGTPISFDVAQYFYQKIPIPLQIPFGVAYLAAIGSVFWVYSYACWYKRSFSPALMYELIVACFLGCLLYTILPACGPAFAFPQLWPVHHLSSFLSSTMPFNGSAPKNCVPSVHAAWAFITWRHVQKGYIPSSNVFFRTLILLWALMVVVSTLVLGQHYLFDLWVGLIFAVGVRAFCAYTIPWSNKIRYQTFLTSILLYGICLFLIFNAIDFLTRHFLMNMSIWIGLLMMAFFFEIRLYQAQRISQAV